MQVKHVAEDIDFSKWLSWVTFKSTISKETGDEWSHSLSLSLSLSLFSLPLSFSLSLSLCLSVTVCLSLCHPLSSLEG